MFSGPLSHIFDPPVQQTKQLQLIKETCIHMLKVTFPLASEKTELDLMVYECDILSSLKQLSCDQLGPTVVRSFYLFLCVTVCIHLTGFRWAVLNPDVSVLGMHPGQIQSKTLCGTSWLTKTSVVARWKAHTTKNCSLCTYLFRLFFRD